MKNISKNVNRVLGKAGFTLIELLVVMAILGILIAVAIAGVGIAQRGARDNTRLRDLTAVKQAIEDYYGSHKAYPTGVGAGATLINSTSSASGSATVTVGSGAPALAIQQSGFTGVVATTGAASSTACPGATTTPATGAWNIAYGVNGSGYYLCTIQENGSIANQSTQ